MSDFAPTAKRVLTVDDDPTIRFLMGRYMDKIGYDSVEAESGEQALALLGKESRFDLVILDMHMAGMNGLETLSAIAKLPGEASSIPVIIVSAESDRKNVMEAIRLGARDFVVKPVDPPAFFHRISRWANTRVEREWERLDPRVGRTLKVAFETLDTAWNKGEAGESVDYAPFAEIGDLMADVASDHDGAADLLEAIRQHDSYTFVHSVRVGTYLTLFSRALGFDTGRTATVAAGGTLHDIGKARTPLNVLNKPGPFDPNEWLVMKEHVTHTVDMLADSGAPDDVMEIARNHHEKIDGTGYPRQLMGEGLSELSRMASIVDAYVALTDRRVYKPAMAPQEALAILIGDPGHFDQELVAVFKERVFRKHRPQG